MTGERNDLPEDIDEHRLNGIDVASKYGTHLNSENAFNSTGLSAENVSLNRQKYGQNAMKAEAKPNLILTYFAYFLNLFSMMLVLAGCFSLILFAIFPSKFMHLYVGLVLILVAFVNAGLEFYQKLKSEQLLRGFLTLVPSNATVIRAGGLSEITADDVVVGDLLVLRTGDKIAADGRLVLARNFKTDDSSLTGESEPVERTVEVETGNYFEAKNLVFNGTLVSSGEAVAIAIRTGEGTVIGKIAKMTSTSPMSESQLSQELDVNVRQIVAIAVCLGLTFMIVSFAQGFGLAVSFEIAIGIFIAFLPQGLPATITILLTVAAKRMAKRNVLVKNLRGVETLGTITLLATDKTGTLTTNKMVVSKLWFNGLVIEELEEAKSMESLDLLLRSFYLCNKCKLDPSEAGKSIDERKILGDATEQGLLRYAAGNVDDFEKKFTNGQDQRLFEIPFSSQSKWHLTIHKTEGNKALILMKGAPEKVLAFCKSALIEGDNVSIDESFNGKFNEIYQRFAGDGQRVIAFAMKEISSAIPEFAKTDDNKYNFEFDDLKFLGLVGLYDPPKQGIKETVKTLKRAGIRVTMITGDHPLTATAIAKQVGILTQYNVKKLLPGQKDSLDEEISDSAVVIHGEMIESITDEEWDRLIQVEEVVFARTQPQHKLKIVEIFQKYGHVVGACGDGVNDSPALKKADLGISMNKTASDVSKEAADMILLDDNFNTILEGIRQGRLIFENLKKSFRYTLTHIFPEVISLVCVAIGGIPFPLNSLMILTFDVFCEVGPAMSFAAEGPPIDLLKLHPRRKPKLKRSSEVIASEKTMWDKSVAIFSKAFVLENEGERLVDLELVLWAYFQGGVIIAIGCMAAYILTFIVNDVPLSLLWRGVNVYFDTTLNSSIQPITLTNGLIASADEQYYILNQAQSAYFLSLIIGQFFNLFLTKHRYRYPHGWDIFRNPYTYLGMFTSAAIGCIVVFVPGIQDAWHAEPVEAIAIAAPFATGLFMIAYEYARKYLVFNGYIGRIPEGRKLLKQRDTELSVQ